MEFGIQFFPDLGPGEQSGADYWAEALHLVGLCDELGYTSVRTVEHYFHPYGGYSPNPIVFLSAAAMLTKKARLITGAVLPTFNNPLKLAGEIGMLDAISGGRSEVGFGRAFLPHEFARFKVSLDESSARFEEGVEQVRRLLEEENVTAEGKFHSFADVTSLPRPTQQPRPPFWIAAVGSPESFARAGRNGYGIMAIPMAGGQMAELTGIYRENWQSAGHPGRGLVMMAFHMLCHPDSAEAANLARGPLNRYLKTRTNRVNSADYPGYDKIVAALGQETFESQVAKGAAWVGSPADIIEQVRECDRLIGGFEIASLQVNFNTVSLQDAEVSMRLFANEVVPNLS